MTKLQILALLLASIALIFFTSCDGEDYQEPDVYKGQDQYGDETPFQIRKETI